MRDAKRKSMPPSESTLSPEAAEVIVDQQREIVGRPGVKRLNILVSQSAYSEVTKLSDESRRSITELIRLGLGLVKVVLEEARQGNKILVTTPDGKPIKELVLPGF